jgi:hypothetical protein
LLYFNFFSGSFCITFLSDGIATSISKKLLLLCAIYLWYPVCCHSWESGWPVLLPVSGDTTHTYNSIVLAQRMGDSCRSTLQNAKESVGPAPLHGPRDANSYCLPAGIGNIFPFPVLIDC